MTDRKQQTMESTLDAVVEVVREIRAPDESVTGLGPQTPVFAGPEGGGLGFDSLDALELLTILEERLGVTVGDPLVIFREVRTIGDVVDQIQGLR